MQTLLRIDSSARLDASHSRALGDHFVARAREQFPNVAVRLRDLQTRPIEHITQDTIAGFYQTPEMMTDADKAATALSDTLIDELQAADTLLITAPMYNFSVPANLKAWIDQIVRIGKTFSYENGAFGGLVKTRTAYVCCAYGAAGYSEGGAFRAANFLEPYLDFLLKFLGVEAVHFISAEMLTADAATVAREIAAARSQIDAHLTALAAE